LPENAGLMLPSLRQNIDNWQQILDSLSQLYLKGIEIDWSGLDRDYQRCKVVLPTYAWQRQRYWIETIKEGTENGQQGIGKTVPFFDDRSQRQVESVNKIIHPLLGQKLDLVDSDRQIIFESLISRSSPAYLDHHRVFGKIVLPGVAYLEMALTAGLTIFQSDNLVIEDLNIHQALILPESGTRKIQLIVIPLPETEAFNFEISSFSTDEDIARQASTLHASGKLLKNRESNASKDIERVDLEKLQKQYTEQSNVQNCYQRLQELGFNYGSSFQAVKKSWSEPGKNVSLIELPDDLVSSAASYTIHPIILDASGHIMNAAIANEIGHEDIYLPIEFKRVKLYRRPTETRFWSQVQLSEVAGSDRQVIKMDGYLLDSDGSVVMEIEGYSGKRTNRQALLRLLQKQLKEEIQERTYQIEWQKTTSQPNGNFETKLNSDPQHWLIFSDRNIGVKLAKYLQQQGHICTLVYPGNSYQNSEPGIYHVNPSSPEDFVTLYQEVLATSDRPLTKVIHLWSIDASPTEKLTISALEAAQKWGCGSVIHLVQALLKQANLPQLWLVTQGAQPVLNPAVAVAQTPLWGMGKVIALEHPQIWGGMVDLDPQTPEGMIEMLLMQMQDQTGEDHLALRQNELYVARVVRQQLPESESLSLRSDSTYLIAGGLGALGLKVAEWMVEQGARYLVLTGRRGASASINREQGIGNREQKVLDGNLSPTQNMPFVEVGAADSQKLDSETIARSPFLVPFFDETAIARLKLMGAKVVVRKADVSQTEEMAGILSEIQTSLPPLKGIIHAAGILEFESIERMTLAQLELSLRAKVTGAWVLHELTKAMDLDFFVGFSSIAAAWGSKGNAHYAAANHFLDGLAHYRQSIGLPMLSVNWGAWAEGGMVSKEAENLLVQMGVKSLDAKTGVNTLGYLMAAGCTQTIVADINWSLFKELYQARGKRSLFQAIEGQRPQKQPAGQQTEIWQKLARLTSPTEIHNISIGYLQSEMARVLRVNTADIDVEQPVDSMGLDSLMALEMCNQIQTDLGVNVPIVKLMEGICLSSLATLISEQLLEMIPKQEVDLAATQDSNWMELVL
jgi:acyl transferase domain-containing protein/acyl carrier protein